MNTTMLAVFGLGGWEVILILAVILVLFGAKKLPELAKGLGQGIKEFKKATNEVTTELQRAANDDDYNRRQVQYHPPEKSVEASSTQPASTPVQPSENKA